MTRTMTRPASVEMSRMRAARAFGLVELLVALAVAATLAALGAPSLRSMLQNQKMSVSANAFLAALDTARTEAMARGLRVDLVPRSAGAGWSSGWQVFIDENGNRRPDPGETVLLTHGALPGGLTVTSTLTDATAPLYIAYNGSGRTRTDAGIDMPQLGTVSFFLDAQIRRIKINFLGRARLCDPATEPQTCS